MDVCLSVWLSFCVSDPLGFLICGCRYTPSSLEPGATPKIVGGVVGGAVMIRALLIAIKWWVIECQEKARLEFICFCFQLETEATGTGRDRTGPMSSGLAVEDEPSVSTTDLDSCTGIINYSLNWTYIPLPKLIGRKDQIKNMVLYCRFQPLLCLNNQNASVKANFSHLQQAFLHFYFSGITNYILNSGCSGGTIITHRETLFPCHYVP